MKLFAWAIAAICGGVVFVGCGGGSTTTAPTTAPGVTLLATPSAFTFALDNNTPVPVTVTRSTGSFSSLGLSVANPTIVGVTAPSLAGGTATFSVIPIARGSTAVTAADPSGATTFVNVSTATCSRAATLVAAQQVLPASGAFGVPTSVGTLYFVAYFTNGTTPSGNLHLVVQPNGTLEGGPLVQATFPPGTAVPTPLPLPGATGVSMSASVPALPAGQQYETELYNDTCQTAVIAGTFST